MFLAGTRYEAFVIDYHKLKNWPFGEREHSYTEKDTILYALGVGLGLDPTDESQLRFVYEENLKTLPTMAAVLGSPGFWAKDPETGIDWKRLVHGEQYLTLHKPIPPSGSVIGRTRITHIVDKGAGKGALLYIERKVTDKASGELLATLLQVTFLRGDGGYSASGQPSDVPPPPLPALPEEPPDAITQLPTTPQMALIYRLSGDTNPLHADPAVAKAAGFPRPILHGMAVYAVACHAILKTHCDYEPERLRSLAVRFSAPIFPGETVQTEMWKREARVFFRARVLERDSIVLNNGLAEIA